MYFKIYRNLRSQYSFDFTITIYFSQQPQHKLSPAKGNTYTEPICSSSKYSFACVSDKKKPGETKSINCGRVFELLSFPGLTREINNLSASQNGWRCSRTPSHRLINIAGVICMLCHVCTTFDRPGAAIASVQPARHEIM